MTPVRFAAIQMVSTAELEPNLAAAARLIGEAARAGAGLVALPIDDRGLDVRPAMREEVLYVSADPERLREPMTVERLASAPLILYDARWGADDPMRRQLRERAQGRLQELQEAGVSDARLYLNDPADGIGGPGAFFLPLDEPEAYGPPPDPVVTTRDLPRMWRPVGTAGALVACLRWKGTS